MQGRILWADDEIDLLKPHVMFLEGKGYIVKTVKSGGDAIDACQDEDFDIIFPMLTYKLFLLSSLCF